MGRLVQQCPKGHFLLGTRLGDIFSPRYWSILVSTRSDDEGVDYSTPRRSDAVMIKIGRIPLGLWRFYHLASFILVAVVTTTSSSSCLAGLIKSLATRLKYITETGSKVVDQYRCNNTENSSHQYVQRPVNAYENTGKSQESG